MGVQCSLYVASEEDVETFRDAGWVPDDWVLGLGHEQILELNKNWAPIRDALFAGFDGEHAAQAVLGGDAIGDPHYTGFGPARLVSVDQVREIAAVLDRIDEAEFRARAARADLWQLHGVAPDRGEGFDEVTDAYLRLRAAYRHAATHEKSVISWLE